jgi:pyruvate ferredoxin oxidoreductase beta subunit
MNTGIQRSSSTPKFAEVSTAPVGSVIPGKQQNKKDLTEIIVSHNIPYVAQTTFMSNFKDLHEKAYKAHYTPGPAFLNVLAPCPRGWRYPPEDLMTICKLAVDSCVWPLYEVIEGEWKLTYEPKTKVPVADYLKLQGRFSHMFEKGAEWMVEDAQAFIDKKWERLLNKCK